MKFNMETINEKQFFNQCGYRHCTNSLKGRRPNVRFCCRRCKSMESIYVLRKKKMLEKAIESELNKINIIKYIKGLTKS